MILCASFGFERGDRLSSPELWWVVSLAISPDKPQPLQSGGFQRVIRAHFPAYTSLKT